MAEKLFDTEERQERIILVGVETAEGDDTKQSLEELEELGQTAGAVTVGMVIQKRERMHPGTYIGKGKIEEVAALVSQCNADTVVCDDELSPAQLRNLSDALEVKVIDRTVMILDIFAKHATTNEGKLQVELAQLRYRSSHLIGERTELSRLGGGIGTRGPGEQKLEQDRRLIRNRISQLKKELEQVTRTRTLTRKKRQENPIPVIAIVGYTNAGKSTLLNIIGGIDSADEGNLVIDGERLADMSEKKLSLYRRKHLGYIFQMYNLIPNLTVRENIEVGAYLSDRPLDVDELLETLGLYEHQRKLPNQLSGGQQQRTAIGRAIVKNPDILLCDEPTGALDYNTSKEILKLIETVNHKYGNTIVMVTHNDAIKDMADRVGKLRDGMIRRNYQNEQKIPAADLEW